MFRNWILVLILIFLALQLVILNRAQAEYRVYRLGVKYSQDQPELEVLSTLDNIQYMTYFKITRDQSTRLIEHWMCPGRTDSFKTYCTKPFTPILNPRGIGATQGISRTPAQSPVDSGNSAKSTAGSQQPTSNVLQ